MQFQLGIALIHQRNQLFHDGIIQQGGLSHQCLLLSVLHLTDAVHDGGAVHIAAAHPQFLQSQEESGGPIFVDANGCFGVHEAGEQLHAVLHIVVIGDVHAKVLLLPEEVIHQQVMLPKQGQIEHQQPLAGMNPRSGEVEDGGGVGDDELGNALRLHGVKDTAEFILIHIRSLYCALPSSLATPMS